MRNSNNSGATLPTINDVRYHSCSLAFSLRSGTDNVMQSARSVLYLLTYGDPADCVTDLTLNGQGKKGMKGGLTPTRSTDDISTMGKLLRRGGSEKGHLGAGSSSSSSSVLFCLCSWSRSGAAVTLLCICILAACAHRRQLQPARPFDLFDRYFYWANIGRNCCTTVTVMDSTTAVHLTNALNSVHGSQITSRLILVVCSLFWTSDFQVYILWVVLELEISDVMVSRLTAVALRLGRIVFSYLYEMH